MSRLTLGDRLTAAAVGLLFGGIIGFALAWLLGVYSNRLGAAVVAVDVRHWVVYCAMGFGAVGLVFGPFVGTLIGWVVNVIYQTEREDHRNPEVPGWLLLPVLVGIVALVWWSAT